MDNMDLVELEDALESASTIPNQIPVCLYVLGMPGGGKTTFVRNLVAKLYENGLPFVINLDPVRKEVPYPTNTDIRDTYVYAKVMRHHSLSESDGIDLCVNMFSTMFDQVVNLIENDGEQHEYIIIDSPGQSEISSWSAGGTIITEAMSSRFPTIIVYVIDTVMSASPESFVSNIMYASSIMRKTKLPFIIVINKIDLIENRYVNGWFEHVNALQQALNNETSSLSDVSNNISASLNEFYRNSKICQVSSITGEGIPEFFALVQEVVKEHFPAFVKREGLQKLFESEENENDSVRGLASASSPEVATEIYIQTLSNFMKSTDIEKMIKIFNKRKNTTDSLDNSINLYKKHLESQRAMTLQK